MSLVISRGTSWKLLSDTVGWKCIQNYSPVSFLMQQALVSSLVGLVQCWRLFCWRRCFKFQKYCLSSSKSRSVCNKNNLMRIQNLVFLIHCPSKNKLYKTTACLARLCISARFAFQKEKSDLGLKKHSGYVIVATINSGNGFQGRT